MAKHENLPFPIGSTYYQGAVPNLPNTSTPDTTSHTDLEGKTYEIEDLDYSVVQNTKPYRTGRYKTVMIVRNISGGAILPKQLCHMETSQTDGTYALTGRVDSNNPALGDLAFPADEFLPSGGVVANDMFYVVIGGPAKVTTDTAGSTTINVGNHVVIGGATAGRVVAQNTSVAAGSATFNQVNGDLGIAVTPTTGNSQDLVIEVRPRILG